MQVVPFIAESAADALTQIRAQLGPEAIVLNVRKLPSDGLSRLWQKPRIEVLATVPPPATPKRTAPAPVIRNDATVRGQWRVKALLESMGILPLYAQQVIEQLHAEHGAVPPDSLAEELPLLKQTLRPMWPAPNASKTGGLHVFVGPQGVGKTTVLCKWLTQSVLLEGQSARVWRLDGRTANTAEMLVVHCDILGVPMERAWSAQQASEPMKFVDLPGVAHGDGVDLQALARQIGEWSSAQVHLVLNAAYESLLLLAQARAFSALPVTDLILTHLDEETRWGKLWNLVLGTNCSVRFLSSGQNIPGEFIEASADKILARQFPLK